MSKERLPTITVAKPLAYLPRFPWLFQSLVMTAMVGLAFATRPWRLPSAQAALGPSLEATDFLFAFAAATVFLLVILRWRLGSRAFSLLFMIAVFVGVAALGAALAGNPGAVIGFSLAVLLHYGVRKVWSFDLVLIVGLAGVCLNLGLAMVPITVAIILMALSFYDLLAVYGTKHMVKMAKRLVEGGGLFALLVPIRPRALNLKLSQIEQKKEVFQLGTGDLVLPGIMAVSAARFGLGIGLAVLAGSLIGLSVNLMIFFKQDKPRPIPALPAPAAGAVLAYLLVTAIS